MSGVVESKNKSNQQDEIKLNTFDITIKVETKQCNTKSRAEEETGLVSSEVLHKKQHHYQTITRSAA